MGKLRRFVIKKNIFWLFLLLRFISNLEATNFVILKLHTGNIRKTVANSQCKVLRAFSFVACIYNKLLFIVRNINNGN